MLLCKGYIPKKFDQAGRNCSEDIVFMSETCTVAAGKTNISHSLRLGDIIKSGKYMHV